MDAQTCKYKYGCQTRITAKDGRTLCAKHGGTEIIQRSDGTVKVLWTGRKGRGSLFQIAACGNADALNVLSAVEIWAALVCASSVPFPLGEGPEVYARVLADLRHDHNPDQLTCAGRPPCTEECNPGRYFKSGAMPQIAIGDLRVQTIERAGTGFNAPVDSYLRIAVDAQKSAQLAQSVGA